MIFPKVFWFCSDVPLLCLSRFLLLKVHFFLFTMLLQIQFMPSCRYDKDNFSSAEKIVDNMGKKGCERGGWIKAELTCSQFRRIHSEWAPSGEEAGAFLILLIGFGLNEKGIKLKLIPELLPQRRLSRPGSATRGLGRCAGWVPRRSRWPVTPWPDPACWQRWAPELLWDSPHRSALTAPAHTHTHTQWRAGWQMIKGMHRH